MINSAYLREQQAMVEHRVGNSGMAVLLDAGMKTGIHPGKKRGSRRTSGAFGISKNLRNERCYGRKSLLCRNGSKE